MRKLSFPRRLLPAVLAGAGLVLVATLARDASNAPRRVTARVLH